MSLLEPISRLLHRDDDARNARHREDLQMISGEAEWGGEMLTAQITGQGSLRPCPARTHH